MFALLALALLAAGSTPASSPRTAFALDSTAGLKIVNVKASAATFKGRKAVHLTVR